MSAEKLCLMADRSNDISRGEYHDIGVYVQLIARCRDVLAEARLEFLGLPLVTGVDH
jgi:hypothetical protein